MSTLPIEPVPAIVDSDSEADTRDAQRLMATPVQTQQREAQEQKL